MKNKLNNCLGTQPACAFFPLKMFSTINDRIICQYQKIRLFLRLFTSKDTIL